MPTLTGERPKQTSQQLIAEAGFGAVFAQPDGKVSGGKIAAFNEYLEFAIALEGGADAGDVSEGVAVAGADIMEGGIDAVEILLQGGEVLCREHALQDAVAGFNQLGGGDIATVDQLKAFGDAFKRIASNVARCQKQGAFVEAEDGPAEGAGANPFEADILDHMIIGEGGGGG